MITTIEECVRDGGSVHQFYSSFTRSTGSVSQQADEFIRRLEKDVIGELESSGYFLSKDCIAEECESLRSNIESLVFAYECSKKPLEESLKRVFDKKSRYGEWYMQSKHGLLTARACCIYEYPNKISIEFND